MFGIALYRGRVLARWGAVLLAAGAVFTLALSVLPDSYYRLLAYPNAAALIALGYSLWRAGEPRKATWVREASSGRARERSGRHENYHSSAQGPAQAGADRPGRGRVRRCAARPRTGRSDPVRSAARLQHRFRRGGNQAVGRRSPDATSGWPPSWSAAFAWFWLWHLDLTESTLVLIAGALIALPLALQESAGDAARDRTVAVTKRSLILAIWGLVVFVYLYYALRAELQHAGGGVCRPASRPGGVAGVGRSPRADRARAAPPPAPPGGATPPGAGPQHLAVLRAARWSRGRRRHALRTDLVLLERTPSSTS